MIDPQVRTTLTEYLDELDANITGLRDAGFILLSGELTEKIDAMRSFIDACDDYYFPTTNAGGSRTGMIPLNRPHDKEE